MMDFMQPTPMDIFFFVIYILAGFFLIILLIKLYKNYRETRSKDVLYFLIGLLLLTTSNVIFILRRFSYELWALPDVGDALTIALQIPSELGVLFISMFAIRFTFPERTKLIVSCVSIIVVVKWIIETIVILQGAPHYVPVNYDIVYSLEYALLRLLLLIPLYIVPPTVFFYYSVKIRGENIPKSNRALWLGVGMLCFAIPFLFVPIGVVTIGHWLRVLEIFVLFAAIIFYIAFTMPKWFKKRIGMSE